MNAKPIIFDGHNDLLTRLWLSSADDPVHDFIYGTLPGHLDLKRCRQAGWMGGLFSIFLPPYAYVKNNHPDKLSIRQTQTSLRKKSLIFAAHN